MAGRPTKYNTEYNEQVYKLALLGATDKEIANFFNVEEKTINNWKEKESEFLQSIKDGKEKADADVASSLFKRALGYEYEEVKEETRGDKVVSKTITKKQIPPDVAAINIWLKNRRGKIKDDEGQRWADKQEVDHTTKGESLNDISKLSTDELIKRAEATSKLSE